jgi:hypothetical protein
MSDTGCQCWDNKAWCGDCYLDEYGKVVFDLEAARAEIERLKSELEFAVTCKHQTCVSLASRVQREQDRDAAYDALRKARDILKDIPNAAPIHLVDMVGYAVEHLDAVLPPEKEAK